MKQLIRALLCMLWDHDDEMTTEYGWTVTRCQRCGETLGTWRVGE